jgi:hypothetical protein
MVPVTCGAHARRDGDVLRRQTHVLIVEALIPSVPVVHADLFGEERDWLAGSRHLGVTGAESVRNREVPATGASVASWSSGSRGRGRRV